MVLLAPHQTFISMPRACVATLGNFDGVHRGHQALLARLQAAAQRTVLPAVVITFEPLSHEFFYPDTRYRICGWRDKVRLLFAHGADQIRIITFNRTLSTLSAKQFIQHYLHTLGVQHLVIGHDFCFGHKKQGDIKTLRRENIFSVEQVTAVCAAEGRISSRKIAQLLSNGQFASAQYLLGHPYALSGKVVYGDQLGRKLGYPTANLKLHNRRPPLRGVYAVRARAATPDPQHPLGMRSWLAVINLGFRPTLGGQPFWRVEAHVIGYVGNLYGAEITLTFYQYLRGEQTFSSLDALRQQIHTDVQRVQDLQKQGLMGLEC